MLSFDVAEENQPLILMYALSGTLLIMFVLFLVFLAHQRKNQLNWYEQNLLEMSNTTQTNYMRCKAMPRLDTDEDRDFEYQCLPSTSTADFAIRKQSRISKIRVETPQRDVTDLFQVPKHHKHTSMFHAIDQTRIDLGLYPTAMETESNYNDEAGFCGSLKLALYIDPNLNLLTVSIKQAIDLVAKRQDGHPNPYFKVALDMPDQTEPKHYQQTKIARSTSSPLIDEEFFFQVNPQNVGNCRLEVMVFDYDQFSVDECIGYCWLTLRRLTVSTLKDQPTIFWAEVLPFDDDSGSGFGEVLFSLTYLSKAQRLTVNVFKARNLAVEHIDTHTLSSNSIRVSIMNNSEKRIKRKKTSAKKNTRNPQYNESLTFNIPKSSLCDTILEIEAIHEHGTFAFQTGSKVVGRLELPLHQVHDLWKAIIREEKSQAQWYSFKEPL